MSTPWPTCYAVARRELDWDLSKLRDGVRYEGFPDPTGRTDHAIGAVLDDLSSPFVVSSEPGSYLRSAYVKLMLCMLEVRRSLANDPEGGSAPVEQLYTDLMTRLVTLRAILLERNL